MFGANNIFRGKRVTVYLMQLCINIDLHEAISKSDFFFL